MCASPAPYIRQYAKLAGVPVHSHTTGRGKMSLEFQIETLGVKLQRGEWVLPSNNEGRLVAPEVRQLVTDMLRWTPTSHVPDRLAACSFARVGLELGGRRAEFGCVNLDPR
jgi:hypothetical protein